MLTYQVRSRGLYTEPLGQKIQFPCDATLCFSFAPAMPFGGPVSAGRTGVVGTNARNIFDSNTGRCVLYSSEPLQPVNFRINLADGSIHFERENCHIRLRCDSRSDLEHVLAGYHYLLPIVLNVEFIDSPVITKVSGTAAAIDFTWGITNPGWVSFDVTSTPLQEQKLESTVRRMRLLDESEASGRRRLVAALHWFHVACRLERMGNAPWEFMAEILLNYAKTLEVLFPSPSGQTLESVRSGLAQFGFSSEEVEAWYVPALALRNNMDVAHVSLASFDQNDLDVIHTYAGEAEPHFRRLLARILDEISAGRWEPPEYLDGGPSGGALATIRKIREAQAKRKDAG